MTYPNYPPAPTYAEVVLIDPQGKPYFNPEWLNWFLKLVQILTTAGAAGPGLAAYNPWCIQPHVVGTTETLTITADNQGVFGYSFTNNGTIVLSGELVIV